MHPAFRVYIVVWAGAAEGQGKETAPARPSFAAGPKKNTQLNAGKTLPAFVCPSLSFSTLTEGILTLSISLQRTLVDIVEPIRYNNREAVLTKKWTLLFCANESQA